jgi:hypothetical protein
MRCSQQAPPVADLVLVRRHVLQCPLLDIILGIRGVDLIPRPRAGFREEKDCSRARAR